MKKQIMVIIILLLVSTNVTTLFFKKSSPPCPRHQGNHRIHSPKKDRAIIDEIKRTIGFTREQHDRHKALNRSTFQKKHELMDSISKKQQKLLELFASDSSNEKAMEKLTEEMGVLYQELNKVSIDHHLTLMEICNDKQKRELKKIYKKMRE